MNSFGVVVTSTVEVGLRSDQEIVKLRQVVRDEAIAQGFSLVDQTKFVTAASELARNTLLYGGGGDATLSVLLNGTRKGLKLTFVDQGAGIADIERALQDGFTSGSGLGLGLGGARRLCDEFEIQSEPGKGTTVSITKWKLR
ncbi:MULTISPECIES: anti-sigma regulatory factor [Paraburkholderia]|jgi:serine/threonine-protein kinase RsbT|uniref:Anti-sigma regulatory factor n=2 Tax=Paraburkholderia caribensis TaxID=75105 RepID=A0A9Q6WLB1_9BURK|nr:MULTISPECIES: anti-sigma regulatory factor [Paraburkholderia]ALL63338.1 anti-sigma B factor RsbT [Paraburkholderia caribensis MBA4]ALP61324.1 anti-sigma regulatory factor [Paraburkholderia caribensis]AMV41208.1 anti-sigma regulatory factor [Paraburkholderia caribensis]AUT50551.1 anti-sigma regulatory factor [Paraburkholderia caribensis]MCO4879634.1 anti-sigma regulatory factor [Paraburkholderia caribensis]